MKVQIRDRDALESLTAANVRAYLKGHGWADAGHWGDRPIVIYRKEQDGRKWEVLVPLRDTASDYAESMAWAVTTLAEAEDRSQLDVFYDLAAGSAGDLVASSNGKGDSPVVNVWCVRADHGKYTDHMVDGSYIGYGGNWPDFSDAKNLHEIRSRLARTAFQDEASKPKITAYAGMMATFLWKIQPGDWVITPYGKDTPHRVEKDGLRYGQVLSRSSWYIPEGSDVCPYTMRRKIAWAEQSLRRENLSESLRGTLGNTPKSVFHVKQRPDFLASIGLRDESSANGQSQCDNPG